MELKNFDQIVERAKQSFRKQRVVIAGADSENILLGAFESQDAGFATPVLVGEAEKIEPMLERLGLKDKPYRLVATQPGNNVVQAAIDLINRGEGDVLMRGNTQTRSFLMRLLDEKNGLRTDKRLTHIDLVSMPEYPKLIAIGDVTVTMTFSESAITDVVIDAAGETAGIGDKVAAEMPALILEHQSVDVTTSATGAYTRSAVQKAAQDCIDQALVVKTAAKPGLTFEPNEFGNPLWLTPELGMFDWRKKPEEPTEFTATEAADVIVVGAGLSGLCAARRSLELGDSVILLETDAKYDVHGFQCAALNPDLLRRECERLGLNYEDYKVDETEFVRNYMTTHGNRCNIDIVRLWAQQSGKALETILEDAGQSLQDASQIASAAQQQRDVVGTASDGMAHVREIADKNFAEMHEAAEKVRSVASMSQELKALIGRLKL